MAIKKTVELDAKFDTQSIDNFNKSVQESGESIDMLNEGVEDLNTDLEETGDIANKSLNRVEKNSQGAQKSVKGIGNAFRAVGGAIKAAGIGLVIAAFATIKELFESNQKVMDFFTTTFNVLSLAFNDFVNFITDNWDSATESITDFFTAKGLKEFGETLKKGIIDRFKQLLEVFGFLGQAMEKLFAGDFAGALETAKEAGVQFFDVITGADGGLEKITEVFTELGEGVSNYTKETIKAAQAQTKLANQVAILQAKQQGILEQNDRLAEQQRQIRDNVNKSLEDRIKANDKLGKILAKQKTDMEVAADLAIELAQLEVDKNGNLENQIALIEAKNEKEAIAAQITGFQSEQDTNKIALQNELLDLTQTQIDAETQRAVNRSQFAAEQIEDETLRIEALQESLKLEDELETERLENQIARLEEGTQARVDAEQELLDFKEDVKQREEELIKELADTQEEADKKAKKEAQDAGDVKIDIAKSTAAVATTLIDDNSKLGKAAGAAQATVNTFEGISNIWTADYTPLLPLPLEIAQRIAATAVVAASGFAAVRGINSTSLQGGGGASFSGGGSVPQVQAPQFNVVGDTSTNQITDAINSQNNQPIKAFVVSSDVTTAQELDRNIIGQASL